MSLNACGEILTKNAKDGATQPTIQAKIGDTWDDVVRNSTLKLGPLPTSAGTIVNEPHTLIYSDPHHRMQFEDVGYTAVTLKYETHRIHDIGIGPYRESVGVDETWKRLHDVIRTMENAEWIPDNARNQGNQPTKSPADLRSRYIGLPGGAGGVEKFWYDEYGGEAWVRLVKTITGNSAGEEPRFNVVIQMRVATFPRSPKTVQ